MSETTKLKFNELSNKEIHGNKQSSAYLMKNLDNNYTIDNKTFAKFTAESVGSIRASANLTNSVTNPKMIEKWIEDFLIEAENTKVPGSFMKTDKKTPLARYNLDRDTLMGYYRVDKDNIDRIYRTLFVYSLGFYECLGDLLAHSYRKDDLRSRIWSVFNILLEYNCRNEYESAVSKLSKIYREQLDSVTKDMKEQLEEYVSENQRVKEKLQESEQRGNQLEANLNIEKGKVQDLSNEIINGMHLHEKEVSMRLKFESKINHLSCVYRELESRFQVVNREMVVLTDRMSNVYNDLTKYKIKNEELYNENVNLNTITLTLRESRNQVENLLKQKNIHIDEYIKIEENLLSELNEKNAEIVEMNSQLNKLKSYSEITNEEKSNLSTHTSMQNDEIVRLNNTITRQDELVTSLQKHLTQEFRENELLKNRLGAADAQINALTVSNNDLGAKKSYFEQKYENTFSMYNMNAIEFETLKFKYNQLNQDFLDNLVKMKLSVRARQESEKFSEQLKARNIDLEDQIDLNNAQILSDKVENDTLRKKVKEQEYLINELEDIRDRLNQSIESQSSYYIQCIKKVEEHLKAERDNTKNFQQKFSEECNKHSITIKQKIAIDSSRIKIDLHYTNLKIEHEELQEKYNKIELKHKALLQEMNSEKFMHGQHKNKLEDVVKKLDDKRTEEESKMTTIESVFKDIIAWKDIEIENLKFHIESCMCEFHRVDQKTEDVKDELFAKLKVIEDMQELNSKLNKDIIENMDLNSKINLENQKQQKYIKDLQMQNTNLENAIKTQRSKEEYLRGEIKREINEKAKLSNTIFELEKLKYSYDNISIKLNRYEKISKETKESEFYYNASTKCKKIQTEVNLGKMEAFDKQNFYSQDLTRRHLSATRLNTMGNLSHLSTNPSLASHTLLHNVTGLSQSNTAVMANSVANMQDHFRQMQTNMGRTRQDLLSKGKRSTVSSEGFRFNFEDTGSNWFNTTRPQTTQSFYSVGVTPGGRPLTQQSNRPLSNKSHYVSEVDVDTWYKDQQSIKHKMGSIKTRNRSKISNLIKASINRTYTHI